MQNDLVACTKAFVTKGAVYERWKARASRCNVRTYITLASTRLHTVVNGGNIEVTVGRSAAALPCWAPGHFHIIRGTSGYVNGLGAERRRRWPACQSARCAIRTQA